MSKAVEFLESLYPGGPWCLSAATPDRDKLDTRSFTDPVAAAQWLDGYNGQRNLYFHVNPARDANARKKLKRTDIASVNYLHVDIDPDKDEAADAAFRTRALGLLQSCNPEPTIIIFSGGGFQGLWKLDTPLLLDGSIEQAEEAKLYNVNLEKKLGGDNCHNIDRLMRLPGTMNVPGEIKRKKGREMVEATLVVFDQSRVYSISSFKKGQHGKKQTPSQTEMGELQIITDLGMLDQWNVPSRVRTVVAKGRDPQAPKRGDDSRSAWLYDCVCQLIRFNVPDNIILSLLLDKEWKISESVLEKASPGPEAYARRQIEKAHRDAVRGEHSKPKDKPADAAAGGHHDAPGSHDGDGQDFDRNDNGAPYPSQRNIRLALTHLGITVRHDRFSDRINVEGLEGFGPLLTDHALRRLWLEIDTRYHFRAPIEFFTAVLEDTAVQNGFHPVIDYLDSLTWDGVPRIDEWLVKHAGAADTDYTRAVSRLLLLAAVRRIRQPGCEFDEMLVLISTTQGHSKSKSIKSLCPNPSWFSDDLPLGADSKVIIERLAGKWIVEAAELKGMRRSDVEQLKSFLSRVSDMARMAYGRFATEMPRQFVLFGTTNSRHFLQDTTGNRRYWPIELTREMDREAIIQQRDQLWAEASLRESRGESIRLARELWGEAGKVQKSHRVDDPLYDLLQAALDGHEGVITSNDIWDLIGIAPERRNGYAAVMGDALRQLGWERKSQHLISSTGKKVTAYVKGDTLNELTVTVDSVTRKARITSHLYEGRPF